MAEAYQVHINTVPKRIKKISDYLLGSVIVLFVLFYFIEPFVILKTFDISPNFSWYTVGFLFALAVLSFALRGIKRNKSATLTIQSDAITLESQHDTLRICYRDLNRISFVIQMFAIKPHRVEFIFHDFQLTRIRLKSSDDFYDIMDSLYDHAPSTLEIDINPMESEDHFKKEIS
ncbi:hypothetical protein [Nibribacter koreensis]|uniref:DUF304 domain-containing protein n=1 Tax=Nibribacter koreensis TaxID=1084519 RepID=A0ABP8FYG4_9BACT